MMKKRAFDWNVSLEIEPLKGKMSIEGVREDVRAMKQVVEMNLLNIQHGKWKV